MAIDVRGLCTSFLKHNSKTSNELLLQETATCVTITASDEKNSILSTLVSRHYPYIQILNLSHAEAIELLRRDSIPTHTLLFRMTNPSPGLHPIQPLLKRLNEIVTFPPISGFSLVSFVRSDSIFWLVTSEIGEIQWTELFEEIVGWDKSDKIEYQEKQMRKWRGDKKDWHSEIQEEEEDNNCITESCKK